MTTDHFKRFAHAVPTRNTGRTTAASIFGFIQTFGLLKRLHPDQGAIFERKNIEKLCKLMGVEKSCTTPYHAMGKSTYERMNQTLI